MSTRCPAQVKRTAVTAGEGTVSRLRRRRILIVLAVLFAAWIGASLYLFVWQPTDKPVPADAVVVLSGGGNYRLDPALELMRRHVAPLLVISGAGLDPRYKKARAICARRPTAFKVLCFDPHPYSTRGEAREIARLAKARGWKQVDVVTSHYHVFRARMIIRRCYHGGLAMIGTHYKLTHLPAEILTEWAKLIYQTTIQRGC
jgi:uncharacterized SAM-binding protein YcdF (DUF218 family)